MACARHVTIIGAGIVGVGCASYLQRAGYRVTIVDSLPPGEGCSFGNAGLISPSSCVPFSMPDLVWQVPRMLADPLGPLAVRRPYLPQALPWLLRFLAAGRSRRVREVSRAMAALHGNCVEAYMPLLKSAGAEDLIRRSGALYVSKKENGALGDALTNALREAARIKAEPVGAAELHQLEPALSLDYRSGLFFPENGHSVNSFRLVQVLAEQVVRGGGKILRRTVSGFRFDAERPTTLVTDGGELAIDTLVIAAGAWSHRLTAQLGTALPLEAERGYHVMLPDPGVFPRLPISNKDHSFAATPMENGLRFAGTVEIGGVDAPPDYRRAKVLLQHGKGMYPGLNTEGMTEWMGCRPSLPDGLPIIDVSPKFPSVLFAFGHSHYGLMGAAITGKLIAELAIGALPSIDLKPYSANRF
ncbi:MAG TPA: FAD-binding oxidoreductase [Stellaceae bacterium]|nr:FAD-binding oxidoreductase [Stellaceae bacterium]